MQARDWKVTDNRNFLDFSSVGALTKKQKSINKIEKKGDSYEIVSVLLEGTYHICTETSKSRLKQFTEGTKYSIHKNPAKDTESYFSEYPGIAKLIHAHLLERLESNEMNMDLGAGDGRHIWPFKNKGRGVVAYEMEPVAVRHLRSQGILTRAVDLNAINRSVSPSCLVYEKQLEEDLKEPANIISFLTFCFLDPEAFQLLLKALVKYAKPGSLFIFVTHLYSEEQEDKKKKEVSHEIIQKAPFFSNSVSSFFNSCEKEVEVFTSHVERNCSDEVNERSRRKYFLEAVIAGKK